VSAGGGIRSSRVRRGTGIKGAPFSSQSLPPVMMVDAIPVNLTQRSCPPCASSATFNNGCNASLFALLLR
jgi:hypothetical protein